MVPRQSRALTNPVSTGRRAVSALRVLMACMLLAALAGPARAEDKKSVVVLEIQGGTKQLQQAILNAIKDKYIVIPVTKWNAAAKKLNVAGQQPEDYALIAADVKVDAVITGKVKQDKDAGGWKLNIAARNGQSGKPIGKMTYDLKSQKVDADTVSQVEKDVPGNVDKAIKGDDPPPVASAAQSSEPAPEPGATENTTLGKDEDPIAKMKKLEEEQRRLAGYQPRPVWYPFIDAAVGFIMSGRNFSFAEEANPSNVGCYDFDRKRADPNDPSPTPAQVFTYGGKLAKCPRYDTSVAGGVHVDITGYPLAFLQANAIRGLGIGVLFDYIFWPPSATGGNNSVNLDTREFRFEVGLRYHYNILNKRSRPSILANVQYGGHYFAVAKQAKSYTYMDDNFMNQTVMGLDDHGLSDIFYQYITIGLGGRVPYYANEKMYFGLLLNINFHVILSYGEIAQAFDKNADAGSLYSVSGYGPTTGGYGLRAGFTPIEAMVWKGLTIRLQAYYELFKYGFQLGSGSNNNVSLPPLDRKTDFGARHIAQAASDNYFGGIVEIGYQY